MPAHYYIMSLYWGYVYISSETDAWMWTPASKQARPPQQRLAEESAYTTAGPGLICVCTICFSPAPVSIYSLTVMGLGEASVSWLPLNTRTSFSVDSLKLPVLWRITKCHIYADMCRKVPHSSHFPSDFCLALVQQCRKADGGRARHPWISSPYSTPISQGNRKIAFINTIECKCHQNLNLDLFRSHIYSPCT